MIRFLKVLTRKYRVLKDIERSDILLLSYPKSGRTWLRVMLVRYYMYIHKLRVPWKQVTELQYLYRLNRSIPKWGVHHFGDPQFVVSDRVRIDAKAIQGKKVIFLIRDPFDVTKSFYRQYWFRKGKDNHLGRSLSKDQRKFLTGSKGGILSVINYHKAIDKYVRTHDNAIVVRYERLLELDEGEFVRILTFLDLSICPETIEQVYEDCSRQNLKKLELNGKLDDYHFGGEGRSAKVFNGEDVEYWNELKKEVSNIIIEDPFYG